MLKSKLLLGILVTLLSCSSSRQAMVVQSFAPIAIDLAKVDQKDYSELIAIVNKTYGDRESFNTASVLNESGNFLYIHVSSSLSGACYRVSIDRNRSKIVNMQPDCPTEVE